MQEVLEFGKGHGKNKWSTTQEAKFFGGNHYNLLSRRLFIKI